MRYCTYHEKWIFYTKTIFYGRAKKCVIISAQATKKSRNKKYEKVDEKILRFEIHILVSIKELIIARAVKIQNVKISLKVGI